MGDPCVADIYRSSIRESYWDIQGSGSGGLIGSWILFESE